MACEKQRFRFLVLLICLIAVILSLPAMANQDLIIVLVSSTYSIALFFTVYVLAESKKLFIFGLLLAMPNILLNLTDAIIINNLITIHIRLLSQLCVDIFVICFLLNHIFTSQRVTSNILFASACIYLLFGFAWSICYTVIELNYPGSFYGVTDLKTISDIDNALVYYLPKFLYYSYITLTTLGYGNIHPLTNAGNAFAVTEALTGQLYLALLIGRLLGLHFSDPQNHPRHYNHHYQNQHQNQTEHIDFDEQHQRKHQQ